MPQSLKKPSYNSYCFIYFDNNLIGYTNSYYEAENICKHNFRYQWGFGLAIKNEKKRKEYYSKLPQLAYSHNSILLMY